MKWIDLIIIFIALSACNNSTPNNVGVINKDIRQYTSDRINQKQLIKNQECNFNTLLTDSNTSKLAIDIYLDNSWNLNNDKESLALLDSLKANNKLTRPFYLKVITKAYKKTDGYFSEGLGLAGKEYVEKNTIEFISNFDNKKCFTDDDLIIWANIVLLEFIISQEDENNKTQFDAFIKKIKSNSVNCSVNQKENLNKFLLILQDKWININKK